MSESRTNPYRTHTCEVLRARARRPDGQAGRLGPSQARPRASAVHRPARSLRPHAVRVHAGLARPSRRPKRLRLESVISVHGQVVGRDRGERQSGAAHRRRRGRRRRRSTCSRRPRRCRSRWPGTQDIPEEQRLRYRFLDLRREKMHANVVLRSQVISSIRRRMTRRRVSRVPDADPHVELAGRRARLSGARAASIRASSTRCRRRRSSSSSC